MTYSSSWVFLFFGPFVQVPPSSTLRMIPILLQEGSPDVYPFDEISAL